VERPSEERYTKESKEIVDTDTRRLLMGGHRRLAETSLDYDNCGGGDSGKNKSE
jgi:hypothetical protein